MQQQIQLSSVALFLREANSFVASSYDAIDRSAPHIYLSALPFAAKDTLIWQYFGSFCNGIVSVETFGVNRHGQSLVMALTDPTAPVNLIAYSRNGQYLASSCGEISSGFFEISWNKTLRVWDTRTGEEVMIPMVVDDHDRIPAIAFVSDDTAVAVCTSKGLVRVWDISTGRDILSWQCDMSNSEIRLAAFFSDGALVATSGWSSELISVWNTTTGKLVFALQGLGYATGIACSSNGRLAAAFEGYPALQIWDCRTGLSIGNPVIVEHSAADIKFSSLAISTDGTVVAAGLSTGKIVVHDLNTPTRASLSIYGPFFVSSLAFSPDGLHLALSRVDSLCLWDWRTEQESETPLRGHTGNISFIAYSPDGVHIASASEDRTIRIWDVGNNTAVPQPLPQPSRMSCLALSSNNTIIVSGSHYGTVQVWDTQNGLQKLQIQLGIQSRVSCVAISPNGRLIASASHPRPSESSNSYSLNSDFLGNSVIRFWNAQTGDPVESMLECSSGVVREMAFLTDMVQLVSASVSSRADSKTCATVQTWNIATGLPWTLGTFDAGFAFGLEPSHVLMSLSPDGQHLAVAVWRAQQVHIWHTRSGRSLGAPFQCPADVSSVAFSCDGTKIVTGTLSGTFEVRDIHGGQIISAHADDIPRQKGSLENNFISGPNFNWLARSLDERFMAREASIETKLHHKMRIWDTETPGVVTTVQLNLVGAAAAFSTDSQSLVIGGRDRIMVWQVEAVLALASEPRYSPLAQLLREGVGMDGWVVGSSGELLLWIPAAYRDYLQLPPCRLMISNQRVVLSCDVTGLHYGTSWTSCWR